MKNWAAANGVVINWSKCGIMQFVGARNRRMDRWVQGHFLDMPIVESYKYLGMTLGFRGSLRVH